VLEYSALDSERFGLRVFRGTFGTLDPDVLLGALLANDVDLAVVRIAAENQYLLHRLDGIGLPWFAADTLVWYESPLTGLQSRPLRNERLVLLLAGDSHLSVLDRLVADIFRGYHNHYASNPLLDSQMVVAAYQDWARRYVGSEARGRFCWLALIDEQPVALVTCELAGSEATIVLNGVLSGYAGRGIYTDMVRYVQRYFGNRGATTLRVSTQLHNRAAQKVWLREGFAFSRAQLTVHVNALLDRSVRAKRQIDVRLAASGSCGSEIHVLHRIVDQVQRQCWNVDYPGARPHRFRCRLLGSLDGRDSCRVAVSYPCDGGPGGSITSLVRVSDEQRQTRLLCYCELDRG